MSIWEAVKVALEGIWVNKLRSGLTTLGIIIGVLAVIIVVTIGQGGRAAIMAEMESLGSNLFIVFLGQVEDGDYERYLITQEECRIIRESVDSISDLVPSGYASATISGQRKKVSCMVIGTDAGYANIRNIAMEKGRFFSGVDNAVGRRVVVINQKLAQDMFGTGGDAIGQKLTINQTPLMVCGVSSDQVSALAGGQTSAIVYMPGTMFQSIFNVKGFGQLEGSAVSKEKVDEAARQTIKMLKARHQVGDKEVYQTFNMEQQVQAASKITGIITMIIGAIAGISLLVGGIGVMNIMLVSVTERTREIGIRMAVGACRRDILVQFLVESTVLSLVGGIIGMVLGMGGAAVICLALKMPVVFSPLVIVLAFLFSAVVGVFFGLYPANRAAKLDPIEALRYE